ncbi:MAG: glycosyltransferase family 39 protein [Candidatus Kerfeldbacteria bacterium]
MIKINKENLMVIGLILFSLAIRIIFVTDIPLSPDSVLYLKLAEKISFGELALNESFNMANLIQPGYSIVISFFNFLVHNPVTTGQMISLISGVLIVLFSYLLSREMFGHKVGMIAGIILAIDPLAIIFSHKVLTESLFACLLIGILLLFWLVIKHKWQWYWFILIGGLIGLAYSIRLVGLSLMFLFFLWLLFEMIKTKKIKYYFIRIALIFVGVLLIVFPYVSYLYSQTGLIIFTGQQAYSSRGMDKYDYEAEDLVYEKRIIYQSLNEDETDYLINNELSNGESKSNYFDSLVVYVKLFFTNFSYNLKYATEILFIVLVYIIIGLFRSKKANKLLPSVFLVMAVPIYLLLYYFAKPPIRYYLPIYPVLIILASWGIYSVSLYVNDKIYNPLKINLKYVVIIIAIFSVFSYNFMILPTFYNQITGIILVWEKQEISDYQKFGQQIQDNYGGDLKIMSSNNLITYYANAEHYVVPFVVEINQLFDFMKLKKIDILFLGNYERYYHELNQKIDNLDDNIKKEQFNDIIGGENYSIYILHK